MPGHASEHYSVKNHSNYMRISLNIGEKRRGKGRGRKEKRDPKQENN